MTLSERYRNIIEWFSANVPSAQSELDFRNEYELLVAVMLSAQCTDRRVNLTTPELFRRYPDIQSLSQADESDILELIRSISYPNAKARHLCETSRRVCTDFGGKIPDKIPELMSLPGIGRKSANVIASIVWGEAVIAVDTHVFRVAHRLGLSKGRTPEAVEKDLESHIAPEYRPIAHHWLILHGRYTCTARKPSCSSCGLTLWCKSFQGK